MTEPVDFVRSPMAGGGTYVNLTRLTDGRVLCQLCFGYFHRQELHEVEPGVVEDTCKPCARLDAEQVLEKQIREGKQ